MSSSPADVSINTAIAICAIAFVSGTARGFSGFGSALIFMPLASSLAAPRLVAALLLIIDFVAAAPLVAECVEAGRPQGHRRHGVRRAGRRADRHLFLTRLDPVTTRWIISGFVFALLLLLLSGWRYRGKDHPALSVGIGGLVGLLQRARADRRPADRRLLARPADRLGDRARQHPVVFRRFGFLFRRELCIDRTDHRRCDPVFAAGRPGLRHRRRLGAALFGRASETLFRAICYALIAAA